MSRFGVQSVVVVALLLVGVAVIPAGGALAASSDVEAVQAGSVFQEDEPANNSTTPYPQQENPNQVNEGGNSEALQEYLASQLSERLANSSISISQGQYEDAQGALSEEYRETLSKYIEVSGGTDGGESGVSERAEQLNETAQIQSQYANTLQNYRDTYDAYQRARENGNAEQARRLARDLRGLSSDVSQFGEVLSAHYQNLSVSTEASFQNETASIRNTTQNVTQQTSAIVTGEFTPTQMAATAETTGSFANPIRITGRVDTNGTTPLNGTIRVHTPGQTFQRNVTSNGSFSLPYRPTEAPTGPLAASVTYVPYPSGPYLGSNSTVQTNVTQVTPSVQLETAPTTVRYNQSVQVSGRVVVAEQAVPNTTVQIHVAGVNVTQIRTNESGQYNISVPLPAAVATGTQPLAIGVGKTGTALAPTKQQTSVSVRETPIELTLSATQDGTEIQVRGHLQTTAGLGVHNQSVALHRNGEIVQSVQTNESGYLSASLPLSEGAEDNGSIEISAAFDGQGTNLGSTQAAATVTFPQSGGLFGTGIPWSIGLAGGGLLGLAGVAYAFVRRRSNDNEDTTAETTTEAPSPTTEPTQESTQAVPGSSWEDRLERATDALEDDDVNHAVRILYGTVRSVYGPDGETSQTHWEFFESASSDLDLSSKAQETLREVTEAYEAVQFADTPPEKDHVKNLLAETETQLEEWTANRNLNPTPSRSEQ